MTEEEKFSKLFKDIKPLKPRNKVHHQAPKPKAIKRSQENSPKRATRYFSANVSPVAPDQKLSYCKPGLSHKIFRDLKRGKMTWQVSLDLHLMTVEQARSASVDFILEAVASDARVIKIVHGKGLSSRNQGLTIKSHLNAWLAQMPEVLAFCSCAPQEGGTGAVLVLLKSSS